MLMVGTPTASPGHQQCQPKWMREAMCACRCVAASACPDGISASTYAESGTCRLLSRRSIQQGHVPEWFGRVSEWLGHVSERLGHASRWLGQAAGSRGQADGRCGQADRCRGQADEVVGRLLRLMNAAARAICIDPLPHRLAVLPSRIAIYSDGVEHGQKRRGSTQLRARGGR